jgi:hypothetical protein
MHLKTYKLEIYRIFTDCFFRKNYVRIRVKFGQVTVKPDIVGARFECEWFVSEMNARETGHSSRWFGRRPGWSYRETGHS